jgi:predicted transcriptional regulator
MYPGSGRWKGLHRAGTGIMEIHMPRNRTKTEIIGKLLTRNRGATITRLQAATGWQAHSIRAALSGLRKKGTVITRSTNARGITVYAAGKSPQTRAGGASGGLAR